MTATKQFIEDAAKGGCDFAELIGEDPFIDGDIYNLLLQPQAWSAVGKVREWYVDTQCRENHSLNYQGTCMMFAWHQFINHRADGKSIEEALAAISK